MALATHEEVLEITLLEEPAPDAPAPKERGRGWDTLSVYLPANTTIQGHPFKAGTEVYYSRRGQIISAILSEPTTLQGTDFPGGTIIHFYRDGCIEWASLSENAKLAPQQPHLPSLTVARAIFYYHNGNIKETTLARATTLQEQVLAAGTAIHLSSDGLLVWAQLSEPTPILSSGSELTGAAGSCASFYRNGAINSITLGSPASIGDYHFPADSLLHFDSGGRLVRAEVCSEPRPLLKAHDTIVHFNSDQTVHRIHKRDCQMPFSSVHTGAWGELSG